MPAINPIWIVRSGTYSFGEFTTSSSTWLKSLFGPLASQSRGGIHDFWADVVKGVGAFNSEPNYLRPAVLGEGDALAIGADTVRMVHRG